MSELGVQIDLNRSQRWLPVQAAQRFAWFFRLQATAVLLLSLALQACTFVLMSPYDEQTDVGVTALNRQVDSLLDELAQATVPTYASERSKYDDIHSSLNALYARNQLREKNKQTIGQLVALMSEIKDLEQLHQQGKVNEVMVAKPSAENPDGGPARASLDQTFRAILKLEIVKKETAKSE